MKKRKKAVKKFWKKTKDLLRRNQANPKSRTAQNNSNSTNQKPNSSIADPKRKKKKKIKRNESHTTWFNKIATYLLSLTP